MMTTIKHTSVMHSLIGIVLQDSANDLLSHLFINDLKIGITLQYTRNSTVANTLVESSSDIEQQTTNTSTSNSTLPCFTFVLTTKTVSSTGIYVLEGKNSTIYSTMIEHYDQGITVEQSENIRILDVRVTNSQVYGIFILQSVNVALDHSKVINFSSLGILSLLSLDVRVSYTKVLKSAVSGMWLEKNRKRDVQNTLGESSAGVAFGYTRNISIIHTIISYTNYTNMSRDVYSSTCDVGLFVYNSSRNVIINTTVERFIKGIIIQSSTYTTLERAKVGPYIEGQGIAIIESAKNIISHAVLTGMNSCIFLNAASNTIIKLSNLTQCNIDIQNSTASTIVFTSIMRREDGISISDSTNSNITHVTIRPTSITRSQEGVGLTLMSVVNVTLVDSQALGYTLVEQVSLLLQEYS